MSMQTDCNYGYGFEVYVSDEKINAFIENHKETIAKLPNGQEVLSFRENHPDESIKEEMYDYTNCLTGDDGFYGLIADVMGEETGIRFEYHRGSEDEEEKIFFPEGLPWYLNEVEKALTKERLDEILKGYMAELGIGGEPDFQRVEYFG